MGLESDRSGCDNDDNNDDESSKDGGRVESKVSRQDAFVLASAFANSRSDRQNTSSPDSHQRTTASSKKSSNDMRTAGKSFPPTLGADHHRMSSSAVACQPSQGEASREDTPGPESPIHSRESRSKELPPSPLVTPPMASNNPPTCPETVPSLPGRTSSKTPVAASGKAIKRGVPHVYHDFSQVPDEVGYIRKKTGGVTQPFPEKLHYMLGVETGTEATSIVSWLPHGRAFIVRKPKEFTETIMPRYFRQTKLTSFQRQLNLYGFRRLTQGADAGAYYHEMFLRGRPTLCQRMVRQKVKGTGHKQPADVDTEPQFYSMPPLLEEHDNTNQSQTTTYEDTRPAAAAATAAAIAAAAIPQHYAASAAAAIPHHFANTITYNAPPRKALAPAPEARPLPSTAIPQPVTSTATYAAQPQQAQAPAPEARPLPTPSSKSAPTHGFTTSTPNIDSPGFQSVRGAAHLLHGIASGFRKNPPKGDNSSPSSTPFLGNPAVGATATSRGTSSMTTSTNETTSTVSSAREKDAPADRRQAAASFLAPGSNTTEFKRE